MKLREGESNQAFFSDVYSGFAGMVRHNITAPFSVAVWIVEKEVLGGQQAI